MDGSKGTGGGGAEGEKPSADQNMSPNTPAATATATGGDDVSAAAAAAAVGRRPFTALSQEEADLALARVLQEQERAYMMLSVHGGEGSDYDAASDAGSYDDYDEDEESEWEEEEEGVGALPGDEDDEVGDAEVDPAGYEDDEAYARALQDAEEREVAERLMALAGITDLGEEMEHDAEDDEDEEDGDSAQDAWEDVDPDEYSYEELVALGEVVGTESRGVSADTLASLPSVTYQAQDKQDNNIEQCVICRVEFEEGESLVALPCKHSYHFDCINRWLQLNKVCPMCSAEVSISDGNKA